MKIGDVLEKGAEVTDWICTAGSYRRMGGKKKFVMKKFKNFTDHCMLLCDAIKGELNEQRLVGNRKPNSIVVCIVA